MTSDLLPPFVHLDFMAPLSDARAARLVTFLTGAAAGTVVDHGCGWAELLLRVVGAAEHLHGVGVDGDERAVVHGRDLAGARGLAGRVDLHVGDARTPAAGPAPVTAAIAIGASQIWGDGDFSRPLPYAAALSALRSSVPRGGRVVYADGIWRSEPTDAAVAGLGGSKDEMLPLAELVELAVRERFAVRAVHEASTDEWDVFESGFGAAWADWLVSHEPDHPDAEQVRARARRQREAYLGGYRDVLGFAYLELVADG